ncbi:uncharacterized [Tachysurus ichikawai]
MIRSGGFFPLGELQICGRAKQSDALWELTESCPDKYCGASRSMPGLMGDVMDMDGRSIFCDSNELEPFGGI